MSVADGRITACAQLLADIHAISAREGITAAALDAMKSKLVALGRQRELFPLADFDMPVAEGRSHPIMVEPDDGYGLYLTIGLPGKMAAPHDHGIWCVNAALAGHERHELFRRTDDGSKPGFGAVEKVAEVIVESGSGLAMANHDIHGTEVVGNEPAVGLALYGYALIRFPSVLWYQPQFGSVRAMPSRRPVSVA